VIALTGTTSAALVGGVDTADYAEAVALCGGYAYIADGWGGLRVVDVSDASAPVLRGGWDSPGYATDVAVSGSYAFLADDDNGLQVISVADPDMPERVAHLWGPPGVPVLGVELAGGLLFLNECHTGFQVVDIVDPTLPVIIGSCDTPGCAWDMCFRDSLAFVADGSAGVSVVNLSDPTQPVVIGTAGAPWSTGCIGIMEDFAYAGALDHGLYIYDISDPTMPTYVGSVSTPGFVTNLEVATEVLYVTDNGSGLQVFDLTDPVFPTVVGAVEVPGGPSDVTLSGDYVYIAARDAGLRIALPQCDTGTPVFLSSFDAEAVDGLVELRWVVGESSEGGEFRLFGSRESDEWQVVFEEIAPGQYVARDQPPQLVLGGEIVYRLHCRDAGGGWALVAIRSVILPGAPGLFRLETPHPNPFNPRTTMRFTLPRSGQIELSVYDQRGRRVKQLVSAGLPAGGHSVDWDGTDGRGSPVASGVYFIRLNADSGTRSQRVTLAR
jgi:hypothetical protein